MTNHAVGIWTWTQSTTIPSFFFFLGDASAKFPGQTEFQSWIVNFLTEVYAKSEESDARNAVDQEIEASSSPKDLINPKSITGKKSVIMKASWWEQNWTSATILIIWSTKLPSVEPWQDNRAKNSYTERKTEECCQRKTIWSCSIRDNCSLLRTHATGDREHNVDWSGDTQEILTQSKHTLRYRK